MKEIKLRVVGDRYLRTPVERLQAFLAILSSLLLIGCFWGPEIPKVNAAMVLSGVKMTGVAGNTIVPTGQIDLIVDSAFGTPLTTEITRLQTDIASDLNTTVQTYSSASWTAATVRAQLVSDYTSHGLTGAILIGDIPYKKVMVVSTLSGVSDFYYAKLGTSPWTDYSTYFAMTSNNYTHATRDIWVGRLKPPGTVLSSRITLLQNYLNKDHSYRTGGITYTQKMNYAANPMTPTEMTTDLTSLYTTLMTNIESMAGLYPGVGPYLVYNYNGTTRKSQIQTAMAEQNEIFIIHSHGGATIDYLGAGGSDNYPYGASPTITYSEIISNPANSMIVMGEACQNSDFSNANYISGWYVFSGNVLISISFSTDTFIPERQAVTSSWAIALGQGVTIGDMFQHQAGDGFELETALFGDPTLRMRTRNLSNPAMLSQTSYTVDLGTFSWSGHGYVTPLTTVTINNVGTTDLKIQGDYGDYSTLGYGEFHLNPDALPGSWSDPCSPGNSMEINIYENSVDALYTGALDRTLVYYTNDPWNPWLTVHIIGTIQT